MRCVIETISKFARGAHHEVAFTFRLVSHSKNPPSMDSFPSDSVRIMASSLDTSVPELRRPCARTALPRAITSRLACKEF